MLRGVWIWSQRHTSAGLTSEHHSLAPTLAELYYTIEQFVVRLDNENLASRRGISVNWQEALTIRPRPER